MFFMFFNIFSQEIKWKNPNKRAYFIDSTSVFLQNFNAIIPNTIKIYSDSSKNQEINNFKIDSINKQILLSNNNKVFIEYYINPNKVSKIVADKDSTQILTFKKNRILTDISKINKKEISIFDQLNSQGSLTRGIVFGNNQSASVQSSFDLKLSGKLSKEIDINAVIYDTNLPVEKGGFTQSINEFEKIYIELLHKNWSLKGGFLDLQENNHFFSKFNQKVLGIESSAKWKSKKMEHNISLAGSFSRGDFFSFKFTGREANQGPYKLQGKNNEKFIIIIPDSEKVFLNGFLLEKGEDKDYIINYNSGEITFTNRNLVTSNSRFTAEYIYTNQNFSRFLYLIKSNHKNENFKISTQLFSQGDQKNKPLEDFNQNDLEILKNAGNNIENLFSGSEVLTSYDSNKVLYKKNNIQGIEFFEFSSNPEDQLYQVDFIDVGKNQGNYISINTPINGKIFEYIQPISGIMQGNFMPIKRLNPPERQTVFSINSEFNTKNTLYKLDLAYSNKDNNLYSDRNHSENHGFASKFSINKIIKTNNLKSENTIDLQFIQKNFSIINRIYSVEFTRDFNLDQEFSNKNQTKFQLLSKNNFKDKLKFDYNFNFINETSIINGIKNDAKIEYNFNKFKFINQTSLLNTLKYANNNIQSDKKTSFLRNFSSIERKSLNNNIVGIYHQSEKNIFKDNQTELIENQSFKWNETAFYSKIGDSLKFNFSSKLYLRKDDSIRNSALNPLSKTIGLKINSQILKTENQNLYSEIHLRKVKFYENNKNENILISTLKWNKSWINKAFKTSLLYELSSGTEAKREFTYEKEKNGNGIYKWTDYNSNGIEEINEFEVAEFRDLAKYIRVFTGNVSLDLINKNRLNFSLTFKPSYLLKNNNKIIEPFSYSFALNKFNSYNKVRDFELNPFNKNELLYQNNSFISNVKYKQISIDKWDLSWNYSQRKNDQFLYIGLESNEFINNEFTANYKIYKNHVLGTLFSKINELSDSQNFINKKYEIDTKLLKFSYKYTFSEFFQSGISFRNQHKNNIKSIEKLSWNELIFDFSWNDTKKTNILGSINYIKNDFKGQSFSLVANQMLEGFKPGNSFSWKLILERSLTAFLKLNLNYESRKSENQNVINSGNVQIKASF